MVFPQAVQDPEERHRTGYAGALNAARISPYGSRIVYLHTEACQKGAVFLPPTCRLSMQLTDVMRNL